jgi:hypothetical protein
MEAHGGHINVESVAGKGTEVFLIFPLSAKNQTKSNTEVQRDGKDECSKTYC